MVKIAQPLTNAQLEILKSFRYELKDEDLKRLKKNLAIFFLDIAMDEADKVWEKESWDETKLEKMLHTKMRRKTNPS